MRRAFVGLLAAVFGVVGVAGLESPSQMVMIYAPEEVQADTPFEAKISVEVHNWETKYAYAFRVYLGMKAGEERSPIFYHSDCKLQLLCLKRRVNLELMRYVRLSYP
jgi:hypothetical protein